MELSKAHFKVCPDLQKAEQMWTTRLLVFYDKLAILISGLKQFHQNSTTNSLHVTILSSLFITIDSFYFSLQFEKEKKKAQLSLGSIRMADSASLPQTPTRLIYPDWRLIFIHHSFSLAHMLQLLQFVHASNMDTDATLSLFYVQCNYY